MEIAKSVIKNICYSGYDSDEWNEVDSKITGHDEYDGGATHKVVLVNRESGLFYKVEYNDWEIGMSEIDGMEEDEEGFAIDDGKTIKAYQVFPKKVTITVYE